MHVAGKNPAAGSGAAGSGAGAARAPPRRHGRDFHSRVARRGLEQRDTPRGHSVNGKVGPDLHQSPASDQRLMAYREIEVGEAVEIGGRRITAIPANHTVPAVGYLLDRGRGHPTRACI